MLAYAKDRRAAGRAGSPQALTLIIVGHAALLAAVMSARMDVGGPVAGVIPKIINVQPEPLPPPAEPEPRSPASAEPASQPSFIDVPPTIIDMGQSETSLIELGPVIRDLPLPGGIGPAIDPPRHVPARTAALPITAESALRPPYPNDKLRNGEEATLKLRLAIDARGRVTAVDPVGPADRSFLQSARRHILRAWRYEPATEGGVAVPSTLVISLAFRLEDA